MTTAEFRQSIIALACWNAAPEEPHQTQLGVCMVLRNRAEAGWFHGDLYENACGQLKSEAEMGAVVHFPDIRDPNFQQLVAKLDAVSTGLVTDRTGGALYWAHKQNLPEKIAGERTAEIGNLIFIK